MDRQGPWIVDEPARLRAALHSGDPRRDDEVSLLVTAAEAGIARELAYHRDEGVSPGRLRELEQQLEKERGLSDDDARWAVQAWAWALSVDEQRLVFAPPGGDTPPQRPFRAREHSFSLAFAALVVAIVAATLVMTRGEPVPEVAASVPSAPAPAPTPAPVVKAPIPTTVDLSRRSAVAVLEAEGFAWAIETLETRRVDPGTVLRQRPVAGRLAEPDSTVTLVVGVAPIDVGRPTAVSLFPTTTSVTLVWGPPTKGSRINHYEIWRDGVLIGERKASRRTFTDGGLTPGSKYRYGIVAVGENRTRTPSHPRAVTLPVPAPPPVEEPPPGPSSGGGPTPPSPSPDPCTAPDPDFCD